MLKIALPIITFLFFVGCNNSNSAASQDERLADTLQFSYRNYQKQLFACEENGPCAQVELQSVQIDSEGDQLSKIQSQIDHRFYNLYGEEQEGQAPFSSVDEVMASFLDEYGRIIEDIPDYASQWTLERSVEVNFNEMGWFGVSFVDFSYTGGAHGNSLLLYSNFNTKTAEAIQLDDLFVNEPGFQSFAEKEFRSSQNVAATTDWMDAGFFFGDEGFYVPNNFFISSMGVHFFYNPYEIAPYSYGAVELFLSWKDALPHLQEEWKSLGRSLQENSFESGRQEA